MAPWDVTQLTAIGRIERESRARQQHGAVDLRHRCRRSVEGWDLEGKRPGTSRVSNWLYDPRA